MFDNGQFHKPPYSRAVEYSLDEVNKVATLVSEKQTAGYYQYTFDAADLVSGVYFYRLQTDQGFNQTRKLVVLK